MKRISAIAGLLWLALCAGLATADVPLEVKGKTETVVTELPFWVSGPQADLYFWSVPAGVEYQEQGATILVTKCPQGRHTFRIKTVTVDWVNKKMTQDTGTKVIVIGKLPEPGPGPEPDPGPKPDPEPGPIPTGELIVLISYESETKSKLPSAQAQIFTSLPVRQYLAAKCKADPSPISADGKAYRIWDDEETGAGDSKLWQDIVKARPPVGDAEPRIYISNGQAEFEGLLPATPAATIELLKKYGG